MLHQLALTHIFLHQRAWDELKQKAIEEKLEKLGVERGTGSNVPHIHAPHARAASVRRPPRGRHVSCLFVTNGFINYYQISSPADPQLLLFKLNKLQQSREAAASANLTPSPNLGLGLSPSPRFIINNHAHPISLTTMPTHPFFDPAATSFDPFGPNSDAVMIAHPDQGIVAPQGRIPVTPSSLVPPQEPSQPASRPDFIRGFGLDIPEEEEEIAEEEANKHVANDSGTPHDPDVSQDIDLDEVDEHRMEPLPIDRTAAASHGAFHSRHVSKLSAALSIQSAGAFEDDAFDGEDEQPSGTPDAVYNGQEDMDLEDVIGEWTGSEDVNLDEPSEGEEVGNCNQPNPRVTDFISRASVNGLTLRTKNALAKSAWNVVYADEHHNKWTNHVVYLIFPVRRKILLLFLCRRMKTSSQIQARKNAYRITGSILA